MSAVEYLPGDRWLVSGPSAALHLVGETAAALRWWPRIRDGVTAQDLVAMLYDEGVLQSSVPFAVIAVEADAVRVIVGGDTVVLVEDAAGHRIQVTGADLLTWNEQLIPAAAVVYVNCATLPAAGDLLPMPAGVVRAGAVRWAVGAQDTRSSEQRSSPPAPTIELPSEATAIDDDPLDHLRVEHVPANDPVADDPMTAVVLVGDDLLDDPVLGDPVLGDPVLGDPVLDDQLLGGEVLDEDVVGDDAVTLIGVVPVAATGPEPGDADSSLPEYVVGPEQVEGDPGSDPVSEPDEEDLEQTVITADPEVDQHRADTVQDNDSPAGSDLGDQSADVHGSGSDGEAPDEEAAPDEDAAPDGDAALEEDLAEQDHSDADWDPATDPVAVDLPGEVTQTVPPEDLEHGDRTDAGAPDGDDDHRDDDGHDDNGHDDDRRDDHRDSSADHERAAAGEPAAHSARDPVEPLVANPFPRMSLPPFVPPSAPGFITSATPSAPQHAPFSPPPFPPQGSGRPQGDGPVGASTIRDVPRPSAPPPFVPASTTLPPISTVPGPTAQIPTAAATSADPDAVATGVPPVGVPSAASPDHRADGDPTPASPDRRGEFSDDESRAGDHDGHTVLAESLPEDHRPPAMPPEPGPGQVYASLCPAGHPNAPYTGDCRVCGTPIPAGDPVLVDRPTMAVLRMSSGAVIELDRRVIVGRAPSVSRVASADVPHLVTVASPHGDVSRSHVEVRVDDWHIVVTDLNSTNGTEIHAPGRSVQMLRAGSGVVVEIGWQIDLGDGAGFLVDHL